MTAHISGETLRSAPQREQPSVTIKVVGQPFCRCRSFLFAREASKQRSQRGRQQDARRERNYRYGQINTGKDILSILQTIISSLSRCTLRRMDGRILLAVVCGFSILRHKTRMSTTRQHVYRSKPNIPSKCHQLVSIADKCCRLGAGDNDISRLSFVADMKSSLRQKLP